VNKLIKSKIPFYILIIINVILSAWFVIQGDIFFHTDIARDFLLLEDIVKNKPLTLIGPRSGGIPGVFHGPLWLYLNLPVFFLGKGNPIAVGWFWVVLFIATLFIIYKVAEKLFDKKIALLSTLLFSTISTSTIRSLFNPFGAVALFPLFFYFFYQYLRKNKILHLLFSYFLIGLIIQFQIAFGLPILILTTVYLTVHLIKTKKIWHLLAAIILIIPLSTYFLFEIRHQFLQFKAILQFIKPEINQQSFKLLPFLISRFQGFFIDGLDVLPAGPYLLKLLFVTLPFLFLFYQTVLKKKNLSYFLFFYFYLGFWSFTFLFKGVIWNYYFWPFSSMTVIFFSSISQFINKKFFYIIFLIIISSALLSNIRDVTNAKIFIGEDASSWKFNFQVADKIFKENNNEFGYYIYTPDQYGYSQKYALSYVQSKNPQIKAYPFVKKNITYLLIAAAPKDRLFLNGDWWKKNQVKIDKKPEKIVKFPNGFKIEKYLLNEEEMKIESDPNLIQTLIFR